VIGSHTARRYGFSLRYMSLNPTWKALALTLSECQIANGGAGFRLLKRRFVVAQQLNGPPHACQGPEILA
jgi:hypothetical protein